MKKLSNVQVTLQVSLNYIIQHENDEQYLQGIGQAEMIAYGGQPVNLLLENGGVLVANVDHVEVDSMTVTELDE